MYSTLILLSLMVICDLIPWSDASTYPSKVNALGKLSDTKLQIHNDSWIELKLEGPTIAMKKEKSTVAYIYKIIGFSNEPTIRIKASYNKKHWNYNSRKERCKELLTISFIKRKRDKIIKEKGKDDQFHMLKNTFILGKNYNW